MLITHEKSIAIVIEDNDASDLAQSIPQEGFPIRNFLEIAIALVKGLEDIHKANIVHNDIKPHNILFDSKNKAIKYIDFGSASQLKQEIKSPIGLHQAQSTLAYISPEQTGRINRIVDYRTDFYSLGITFYQLICGKLPFEEHEPIALIHEHIAGRPIPVHLRKMGIPIVVSKIIEKLIAKDAEDRYQSCYGLLHDLEQCLSRLNHKEEIEPFLLGEKDYSEKFQIPQKLYGRDREIANLLDTFEKVSQGATEVLMVKGYSGIGKSFLINEVRASLTMKNGLFVYGKFDQLNKNIAFSAFIEVINSLVQHVLAETEENLACWKENLLEAVNGNGQLLIDLAPTLESVLGKQAAPKTVEPEHAKNRFYMTLLKFMQVFCSKEHPLVIFIDDLQWADLGSLALFESILESKRLHNLLLIGAYRDNELNTMHPAQLTLNKLREYSNVNTIHLTPLTIENVNTWIAEALHSDPIHSQLISECIYKKTQGNPFFIKVFLQSLYDEGLIHLTSKGSFSCDVKTITEHPAADNVIQLMGYHLSQLPKSTQALLAQASCFGKNFINDDLCLLTGKTPEQINSDLLAAIDTGVLNLSNSQFTFAHDRIQESAYSMLNDSEKKHTHLHIGRLLLNIHTEADIQQNILYDIVDHLNIGEPFIIESEERKRIAQLNLIAAQKAKSAAAYNSSLNYLQMSEVFLKGYDIWKEDYTLAFSLYKELAELKYLNAQFDASEETVYFMLPYLQRVTDKIEVNSILIIQKTMQAKYKEAIEFGKNALQLLGMEFPAENIKQSIDAEFEEVKEKLGERAVASLLDLPSMQNVESKAAIKILFNLFGVCYLSGSDLLPLVVIRMVKQSLGYGNTAESCMGYATYGMFLGLLFNEYHHGYEFGRLAIALSERLDDNVQKCRCYNVIVNCIHNWSKPISDIMPHIEEGFKAGLVSGELQYAGYLSQFKIRTLYKQGYPLVNLLKESTQQIEFCQSTKNQVAVDLILAVQIIAENLTAQTASDLEFGLENLSEETYIKNCEGNGSFSALCLYYIMKAQVLYLYELPEEAIKYIEKAEKLLAYITGQYALANYYFYSSLIITALYAKAEKLTQASFSNQLESNQAKLKHWAKACPENFEHKYYLVEAERARINQQPDVARKWYKQAEKSCRGNSFVQEHALISELAGKFWLSEDEELCAKGYLNEAYKHYKRWEAIRKIEKLKSQYHAFLTPVNSYNGLQNSINNTTLSWDSLKFLDLANLLKVSQTISQEMDLSKLLSTIMQSVVMLSGAQKGALLLVNKEQIEVQAEYFDSKKISVLSNIPINKWEHGASSILNYVIRRPIPIVLGNAVEEGAFTQDDYIKRAKVKSILCIPILKHETLKGLLYLENNLSKYVFSKQHVDILNVLASQMIISLQNAIYHKEQLELTKHLSEQSAKVAAAEALQAEQEKFTANLSHELINPMFAISSYVALSLAAINSLKDAFKLPFVVLGEKAKEEIPFHLSELQSSLDNLEECSKYVTQITRNVLRIQKIESGIQRPDNYPFRPKEVITSIIKIFNSQAEKKSLDLLTDLPAGDLVVKGDKALINEILFNLTSNATKFTDKGSITLKLSATEENDISTLNFSIIDTGIGMTELAQAFERFSQAKPQRVTEEYSGTGLGLSLAKKQIEILGGMIEITSIKGQGTAISFTIPCKRLSKEEYNTFIREIDKVSVQNLYQKKILIVDDNKQNQKLLSKILEKRGCLCDIADNGEQALEKYPLSSWDLILLDVEMPGINGYDTARKIRNIEEIQSRNITPIIFLSAHSLEELKGNTHEIIACDYFSKGTSHESLFSLIEKNLLLDSNEKKDTRTPWQFEFSQNASSSQINASLSQRTVSDKP